MPKVRMLQDAPGSPDGTTVNEYVKDRVYDVPQDLADAFVKFELAEVDTSKAAKRASTPAENKRVA